MKQKGETVKKNMYIFKDLQEHLICKWQNKFYLTKAVCQIPRTRLVITGREYCINAKKKKLRNFGVSMRMKIQMVVALL